MSEEHIDTVIATIPKNSREELRVTLGEFKGHNLLHLRTWVSESGTPTKNGFGIQARLIPQLRQAIVEAEAECRLRGWIAAGGA